MIRDKHAASRMAVPGQLVLRALRAEPARKLYGLRYRPVGGQA